MFSFWFWSYYIFFIPFLLFFFGSLFDIFGCLFKLFGCLGDIHLLSTSPVEVKKGNKLHNEYVVGLCDTEATSTISVTKDNKIRKSSRRSSDNFRIIYSVHPCFAISLNKDWHLIYSLQSFFGVALIFVKKNKKKKK